MKFKLLAGSHSEGERIYRPGEIIDSELNLERFNGAGVYPKFERLHEDSAGNGMVALPPKAHVWDPAKETVEEFAQRMKGEAPQPSIVQEAVKKGFDTIHTDAKKYPPRDLSKLSEKELVDVAAEEEIDLKGTKGKDAILKLLRAAGCS